MTGHDGGTATVHDDHAPNVIPIKSGIYTTGYFVACACGFTTGEHERHPGAIAAYQKHLTDSGIRPQAKDTPK